MCCGEYPPDSPWCPLTSEYVYPLLALSVSDRRMHAARLEAAAFRTLVQYGGEYEVHAADWAESWARRVCGSAESQNGQMLAGTGVG